MPNPHSRKRRAAPGAVDGASREGSTRKAASEVAGLTLGGSGRGQAAYSFAGDIGELAKVLTETRFPKGYRAVVIPKTHAAEDALKKTSQFRPMRLDGRTRVKAAVKNPDSGADGRAAAPPRSETDRVRIVGLGQARSVGAGAADIEADAYRPSARARAILRGREYAEADLRVAGGAFDLEEVRKLLNGVSRQAIDKRVAEGSLLVVPGPSGHRRFPTFQFNADGAPVAGLREVCRALDFASPWAILNFLCNGNDALDGQPPIDALHEGAVDRVVQAAAGMGVQGA